MARTDYDAVVELYLSARDTHGAHDPRTVALASAVHALAEIRYEITQATLAGLPAAGFNVIDRWTGESESHHRTRWDAAGAASHLNHTFAHTCIDDLTTEVAA